MIDINQVTKIYSKGSLPAVDGLSLQIRPGQITGLVGLNGAGKTTTIRMAAGIILPTSGKIKVDEHDIVHEKVKAARSIGWVPEFPNFEPNAKPLALMKYYGGFYQLKGEDLDKRARDLLEKVGLSNDLRKKLREYSQGMKKRFAIAESLIGDPANVMFDETLNGLDPEGVRFVRNLILDMKKEGKAVMLSSHILSEIENVADDVAIIYKGRKIKSLVRDDFKTLGKMIIHIKVANKDQNIRALLERFGVIEDDSDEILLTDLKIDEGSVNEILEVLVTNKYKVTKFDPVGESLEEYFFKLMGDQK